LMYLTVGNMDSISSVAFSPDCKLIAVCGDSGDAYILPVSLPDASMVGVHLLSREREQSWEDLTLDDAKKAFQGILRLEQDSGPVEEFLDRHLKPAVEGDNQQITRWIEGLGSKSFSEREEATRQLASAGEAASMALINASATELSPEARSRVRRLLERLDAGPTAEPLQVLRAIEVLERRAKPAAIPILKRLAGGAAGFAVTVDSQETLARLEKKLR